jgi:hypothetical protein
MENVLKYVAKNYDFFKQVCLNITKDEEQAQELWHSIIDYIGTKYNKKTFNKALKNNTLLYLIIYCIKNEYTSAKSYYSRANQIQIKKKIFIDDSSSDYEDEKTYDVTINEPPSVTKDIEYREVREMVGGALKYLIKRKSIDWWEGEVYKIYVFEQKTYAEIQKDTKINASSAFLAKKKVEEKIYKLIKEKYGSKL